MNSNKKIALITLSLVTLLTTIIIILVAIGSRENGYRNAQQKAYLTADIVKESLTSHMVNANMEQIDVFLKSISQVNGIKNLWLIRAESISKQFGKSLLANEVPKDGIDAEVLNMGKERVVIDESLFDVKLRITIPYVASSLTTPNCLLCHDAKEGDVLGVISLVFDIKEDRNASIVVLLYIIATITIFFVIILLFLRKKITPYTKSFDQITKVLKKVHEGNYSVRAKEGILKEDKETSVWLNDLISKLETVLTEIEKNLTTFVYSRALSVHNDKLLVAKEIIGDMSEIYNYKKTIENDLTSTDIYRRLASVFKNKLSLKDFFIFENDLLQNERKTIYSSSETKSCCNFDKNIKSCRALRLNSIVNSTFFPKICPIADSQDNEHYLCIPYSISEQKSMVLHIILKEQTQVDDLKYKIGIIKKYLEETKPILEAKMLMDILRKNNLMDPLTKLYNRKYLDEFIQKVLPFAIKKGINFTIMFLDIDYFKLVNDTYGHDVGDDILVQLANTMKKCTSKNECIIRYGGEEFLILSQNLSENQSKELAIKINQEFSKVVFSYDDATFHKTVSIGYSIFPKDNNKFWDCVKYADIALYEAKNTGRNKVVRFLKNMLKDGGGTVSN